VRVALSTLATFAALVTACVPTPRAPVPPVPSTPAPAIAGERFEIKPGAGQLTIKVYRDGPLKALGHNHVITANQLHGFVVIADHPLESQAELWFDVADLLVDDPAARSNAGADFQSTPSAADIEGTRRNMASERVLDATAYPRIEAHIRATAVDAEQLDLDLEVRVSLPLVAGYTRSAEGLEVTAQFSVDQGDLGLEPYSVLGGALRVAPRLDIDVDLHMTAAH